MILHDKNLYSAIIRNAEALGGKNVSQNAVKKVSFQSLFKSCQGVRVDDIVRQWVPNGRCSDSESTAGKNCSTQWEKITLKKQWNVWLSHHATLTPATNKMPFNEFLVHFQTFCRNYPHIDLAFVDFVITPAILAT